jgi:endonuclease/exonuclease/phosphatase family metal-dependent hydrolase
MGRLRLVTINFWGLREPLDRRLALASRQLAALAPDVIGMQEVRPMADAGGRTTAEVLAEELDMQLRYEVALEWAENAFHEGFPAGQEGLAILSRRPILEHRVQRLPEARATEARILLSALVDHPDGPVWCHTTHLHWRLDDGVAREHQVVAIDGVLQAIDTEQPQLLCGDFNAGPEHDEIRFLRGMTTLAGRRTHYQDAWDHVHPGEPGYTWSMHNPHTHPMRSLDFDRRIDYIFVTTRKKDGRGTVRDCRVVLDHSDDTGICASDHYGLLADVEVGPAGQV